MLVVVALVGFFVLRPTGYVKPKPIRCVNNLKNVGLAFRIFATDNADRFPAEMMLTNGIPLKSIDALRVYLMLTNYISTPDRLWCPSDKGREVASSIGNVGPKNISYFASLSAAEAMPQAFLAGDRNLETNGVTVPSGILAVTNGMELSWSKEIHNEQGNIAMGDGSVQQFSSTRLKQGVRDQGLERNYLAIP